MDFFLTFAECAITFAGFAAVHAVLQGSSSPPLPGNPCITAWP